MKIEASKRLSNEVNAAPLKADKLVKRVDQAIKNANSDDGWDGDTWTIDDFTGIVKRGKKLYLYSECGYVSREFEDYFGGEELNVQITSGKDALEKYTKWAQGIREKTLAKFDKEVEQKRARLEKSLQSTLQVQK